MFITVFSAYSGQFLTVMGAITVALFIPMMIWPLQWARRLNWKTTQSDLLALYFGRCLGAVSVSLGLAACYVAQHPYLHKFFFCIMAGNFAAMVAIHLIGAIRKIQPRSESYEIIVWFGLLLMTGAFWPNSR
jgi:hypothetical protein